MIVRLAPNVASDAADLGLAGESEAHADVFVALQHPDEVIERGVTTLMHVSLSVGQVGLLAAWCHANSYVPPGSGVLATERNRAKRLSRAATNLYGELDRLAQHPAYRRRGVFGTDRTVFPGWRCGEDGTVWPSAAQAVLSSDGEDDPTECWLVPETTNVSGQNVTLWSATTDRPASFA